MPVIRYVPKDRELNVELARKNLSASAFADQIGVSPSTISRLLDGRQIRKGMALLVCASLGRKLEELFVLAPAESEAA